MPLLLLVLGALLLVHVVGNTLGYLAVRRDHPAGARPFNWRVLFPPLFVLNCVLYYAWLDRRNP